MTTYKNLQILNKWGYCKHKESISYKILGIHQEGDALILDAEKFENPQEM